MNLKTATGMMLFAILGGGCINVFESTKQPQVVVVPGEVLTSADALTIAEIDAAFTLNFEEDIVSRLSRVAQRPSLSPTVQNYLIARTLRNVSFDNNKVHVLVLLINNPIFCNTAKQEILSNLKRFSFDDNKKSVLDAIEKRGSLPS